MKRILYLALMSSMLAGTAVSCSDDDDSNSIVFNQSVVSEAPDFVDSRDGNTYKCIKVGNQVWMAENLRYESPLYAVDGCFTWGLAPLKEGAIVIDSETKKTIALSVVNDPQYEWESPYTVDYVTMYFTMYPMFTSYLASMFPDFWAVYTAELEGDGVTKLVAKSNFDEAESDNGNYKTEYGLLYSYEGALKAVPEGWRLPSDEDWMKLETALGMSVSDAQACDEWRGPGVGKLLSYGGESGFNALFGGGNIYVKANSLKYDKKDECWYFWTSTRFTEGETDTEYAMFRMSAIYSDMVWRGKSRTDNGYRPILYSVRCVKDAN